ncbi:Uncharacterised protein [Mycobacteroides abscessus subsp. abscessus]|uniref:hypothetical protein n=1 Tax=Mycobacteroides abscessus TaxID=36809 RepID=UPI00092C68E1|nr:hypothetical protein [Mycobacteroides abscessus]SHQ53615.1 Uncharacterised protein [Mycobacteroides abscessus subsp. abscessus]SHR82050.1 Uncharacterised protein [Mycobacteroides abscessus subsp. abscessus]SLL30951.1 Uncharacterised protein [Mycobacteroides abscessus subsp. abscessus]
MLAVDARLDQYIGRRLTAMGHRRGDLAALGGPSRSHMAKVFAGQRALTERMALRIDNALCWVAGSTMQAARDGTAPTPRDFPGPLRSLLSEASDLNDQVRRDTDQISASIAKTCAAVDQFPAQHTTGVMRESLRSAQDHLTHAQRLMTRLHHKLQHSHDWIP